MPDTAADFAQYVAILRSQGYGVGSVNFGDGTVTTAMLEESMAIAKRTLHPRPEQMVYGSKPLTMKINFGKIELKGT